MLRSHEGPALSGSAVKRVNGIAGLRVPARPDRHLTTCQASTPPSDSTRGVARVQEVLEREESR